MAVARVIVFMYGIVAGLSYRLCRCLSSAFNAPVNSSFGDRSDSLHRETLSEQGLRYATGFSWLVIAYQHIRLYESFLAQRHAGTA